MGIDDLEREELSNKTEIEKLLDEIKNSAIGFENYKQFFDKIKNSDQVIMTQIENLVREYREYKVRFTNEFTKDSHKQLMDDGFCKREVFEDSRMMNKALLEAYNWKTLQEELYNIIFKKIYIVLDDARALDIKRDALKEMREMDAQRNALALEQTRETMGMTKDIVGGQLQTFNEKFINLVMMIDEDNRRDRKDIFDTLKKIVENISTIDGPKKKEIVNEVQQEEIVSKRERLQNVVAEPIVQEEQAPTRTRTQPRQRESVKIKPNIKMDDIDEEFNSIDDDDDEIDSEEKFDKF